MKRTHGISALALAAALLAMPALTVPAAGCMMPPPGEESAQLDALLPGVPVSGEPERQDGAVREKYVIIAPAETGATPHIVRWNGLDVAPAPQILVVYGDPAAVRPVPALLYGAAREPRTVQLAVRPADTD
jgi:hypothetical protein